MSDPTHMIEALSVLHVQGDDVNVLFGLYLDRAPWAYRDSALGEVRLGPLGLTQLLQTRLGLTGPDARHSTRIRQYMARLADQDIPAAWFHGSFSVDAWSTAIDLLNQRDELVVNGWTGVAPTGSTAKLLALAALEQSPLPWTGRSPTFPWNSSTNSKATPPRTGRSGSPGSNSSTPAARSPPSGAVSSPPSNGAE